MNKFEVITKLTCGAMLLSLLADLGRSKAEDSKKETDTTPAVVPSVQEWKEYKISNHTYWALLCSEMEPGKARDHNDPHEIELYFVGSDKSKWRATKWERTAEP